MLLLLLLYLLLQLLVCFLKILQSIILDWSGIVSIIVTLVPVLGPGHVVHKQVLKIGAVQRDSSGMDLLGRLIPGQFSLQSSARSH